MTQLSAEQAHQKVRRAIERETLVNWLRNGASCAEIENLSPIGLLDNQRRFTEHTKRQYLKLWSWSAPRFSGIAGFAQDALYRRNPGQLERRIQRAKRIINALTHGR